MTPECPPEEHVHCDVCHVAVPLIGDVFAVNREDGVQILCKEDAKEYAKVYAIELEVD